MMRHLMTVCLLLVGLALAAVACSPSGGQEAPVSDTTAIEGTTGPALAPAGGTDTAGQTAPITGTLATPPAAGQVVEATPLSESELAAQPPGQTEGGAAQGDDAQTEPGDAGDESAASTETQVYSDGAYGFSLVAPANFVIQAADPARLSGLVPTPDAAVYFMEPGLAESALAGTDAPNLEVRVFETGPVAALSDWLAAAGLGADQTQTATALGSGLSGVEVCGTTMIVPNCSLFIAGGERVYQLRALDQAGEAMAQSFVVTP